MLRRISAAIRDTRILFWLGIAVILFAAFLAVPVVMRATDVRLYERIGIDAFAVHAPGMIPATLTWYPPPATVMMGFIKAATHLPFGIVWLVTITAMIIGAIMMTERRYGKSDALMVTMALAASVLLLGPHLAFSRFDIVAGLPILLGFVALRRGKTVDALVFMLLAGGIKLLPFALVPLVFLLRPKTEWRRLGIVSAIIIVGMAGVSLLLLGPTAIRAFMQEFFVFHAGRGFQVESIWSSVLLLVDHLRGTSSAVAYHHYAFHNDSLPSAMRGIGAIIYLSGMLFFLFRAWRMPTLSVSRHVLPLLLWMIAAASILSTGYLAWALPALFFALFRSADSIVLRKYQWWLTAGTVFTVAICTRILYPFLYEDLVQKQTLASILVLNLRNILLFLLIWVTARASWDTDTSCRPIIADSAQPRISAGGQPVVPADPPAPGRRSLFTWFIVIACSLIVFRLGIFKIMDRDFWWHITAGKVMVQTWSLISIDPFAYSRAGLPYIATHEWLAQIILYLIHAIGGVNGIILFRAFTGVLIASLLFLIDRRHARWTAPFIVLAMIAVRPTLLERPQLFTFVFFTIFLLLSFKYLDVAPGSKLRRRIQILFPVLAVLWGNVHGAAVIVGMGIVGLLWLQEGWMLWQNREIAVSSIKRNEWLWLTVSLTGTVLALFVHPAGLHTGSYIVSLFTDQTTVFIREWMPGDFDAFVHAFWPLIIISTVAVWQRKRAPVFSIGLLVSMLILSRTAIRHEPLLAIALAAVTLWQLRHNVRFGNILAGFERRKWLAAFVSALLIFLVGVRAWSVSDSYAEQDHLWGFGAFDLARGAYDFLEQEKIEGKMFNTYGIGGYLMYRGYPDRKIYIDGRNVDYGLDFMFKTFRAGKDPDVWKQLEDQYGFTYALIDFNVVREEGNISYARHLDTNPVWALVYVDDWVAVYLKNTKENAPIVKRLRYTHVTPHLLEGNLLAQQTTIDDVEAVAEELRRVIADNPEGIKGRIELGKILLRQGRGDEARLQAEAAIVQQPRRPEPYVLLAAIDVAAGRKTEAAQSMISVLRFTGRNYPEMDIPAIADVLKQGGHPYRAAWLRLIAGIGAEDEGQQPVTEKEPGPDISRDGLLPQDPASGLDLNFEPDILKAIDEGIAFAEQKDFSAAKERFLKALVWDPGYPSTLSNLCALMIDMNELDEARGYCERALERGKEFADVHYNLAIMALRQNRLEDARTSAAEAKRLGRDIRSLEPFLNR